MSPPTGGRKGRPYVGKKEAEMFKLLGIVVFVLDIIAIVSILKSSAETGTKILWLILVILLPFVGMILYFLMGPGRRAVI